MKVYQLKGTGVSVNGWSSTFYSRDIFADAKEATRHIPEFVERCTTSTISWVEYAEPEGFKVVVLELEFHP